MIPTFTHTNRKGIMNTSLKGYVDVRFEQLVETFGEPDDWLDGDKVDVEWYLKFIDGTVATIYNYKDGKAYLGARGKNVEDITCWHIGGNSPKAVEYVREILEEQLMK